MVEAFEKRLQFSEMLNSFSSNKKALSAASNFSLKNYEFHDEIFDCILDELTDMKNSSFYLKNVFILLENICSVSMANAWFGYRDSFQRNVKHIYTCIFHPKRHLDYNISYIIKLSEVMCHREWFDTETALLIGKMTQRYMDNAVRSSKEEKNLDKAEIFERMEEEREYQKKLKEHLWLRKVSTAVDPDAHEREEVDDLLNSVSDLNAQDMNDLFGELKKYNHVKMINSLEM